MDELIKDLETAITLLPWAGEVSAYTTERVTKGYAHSLLANIALSRAGWSIREEQKNGYVTADKTRIRLSYPNVAMTLPATKMYELALKHLATVIDNGTHQLNPSFANEWYLIKPTPIG